MAQISNKELVDLITKKYPQIGNHTAEDAYKLITETGYGEITMDDPEYTSNFFGLLMRVYLSQVNISHVKDPLEDSGFGEYYDMPWGGITQRLAIDSVKPISAGWKNLKSGDSVDPFTVRKPSTHERFFPQNFDYASLITVPDDYEMKHIFVSSYGMSEFMGGIMTGLQNGYVLQQYLMKRDALNAALHQIKYPLQDTQKISVHLSNNPTAAELKEFLLQVKTLITLMKINPQSGEFNAMKFESTQDVSRLKLLVRPGIKEAIDVELMASAYNADKLNLPIDIIVVPDFGGLKATSDGTTPLYPVYDKLGAQIGYNTEKDSDSVTVENDAVVWVDPNKDIVAMVADKGLVFSMRQNPYRVEPIRNPRGLYTNYWASSPNNSINVDMLYNMVVFENKQE